VSFRHLDRFADHASALTRLAPSARLGMVFVLALGSATLPPGAWPQMAAFLVVVVGLAAAAGMRPNVLAVRSLGPLLFVLLASIALLLLVPGRPLLRLGPLAVTDAGLLRFGSIIGRALPAIGAAVLLVSTTRFPEIVEALRAFRFPVVVTASLGLAYRFLYLLLDELERLRRAAASRNAGAGEAHRRRLSVGLAAAAVTRTFAHSERTYRAMLARGYRGDLPLLHPHPLDRFSGAVLGATTLVGLFIALSARWPS
jgi:cobalt/nickel transport system permease protein